MVVRLSEVSSKQAKNAFWIFCFIPMKISQSFLCSKDGSKFYWLPWFPANSLLCVMLRYTVLVRRIETFLLNFLLNIIIEMMQRFKDSPTSNVKYKEVLRIYAIRICLILGLLMNAKNKKCMTTHLTKGVVFSKEWVSCWLRKFSLFKWHNFTKRL